MAGFILASAVQKCREAGYGVRLPWGTNKEREQAEHIAKAHPMAEVLPHLNLRALAGVLAGARGIAAVDTGLAHLAAALGRPAVVLYGPSEPALIGTWGRDSNTCRPRVSGASWQTFLRKGLARTATNPGKIMQIAFCLF